MKLLNSLLVASLLLIVSDSPAQPQNNKTVSPTPLSLLRSFESKVTWNPQTLLKADFDYDGVDDYALGGKTGDRYVVGILKGPLSEKSQHWTLTFSADPGSQGALCSVVSAEIELEQL